MIVSDRPAPKHRIAGATPNRHALVPGKTLPQFYASDIIKRNDDLLPAIRTRRSAR